MGVKEFRHRYIVFEIEAPRVIERWELIKEFQRIASRMGLDQTDEIRPWLTAFQNNRGILRCSHNDRDKAIELLKAINEVGEDRVKVTIDTITTSGTIKKAKESL
ncbi:MAG: Rpp14/Pop5 family protein [Thermoplasmata archaeon]|nr:Rpp14/Pop5 family protein [Thermoplasmata archaeon]